MSARVHTVRRTLAAAAVVLAVLAASAGTPAAPTRVASAAIGDGERTDAFIARTVDALQLAAWIREGVRDLRVLDLRGDSAYEAAHIPSAEAADFARLDTLAARGDAVLVLYSDDDVRDARAWANLAARGHRHAYVLNGGMDAWRHEVMDPVLHGDSTDYVATLSRYFGGVPRVDGAGSQDAIRPRANDARGHEATAPTRSAGPAAATTGEFGETWRRGC
ncbi:MAG: rhodanese-like domain-containing protein [Gemmatimonadaceae bacterium]